ncbi:MAG: transposase [Verrucomicrobiota bacterium]
MKITTKLNETQSESVLNISFDVSKERLYYYSELPGPGNSTDQIKHAISNRNQAVIQELSKLQELALKRGFEGIRVICEPTGGFERRLLRLARKQGHRTAYVNGESVHKLQVVESNDANKTDIKDPKTILLLAKLGKTLKHLNLSGSWLVLREYNVRYERLEVQMIELKNRIYRILRHLFCEISFKKDWLFGSEAALKFCQSYGFNPYRMLSCGEKRVATRLKKLGLKNNTIRRLPEDARISVLQEIDPNLIAFLEEDFRMEYAALKRCQEQMARAREAMIGLLDQLISEGQVRIQPAKGLISPFMLARLMAETGPLDDFKNSRQLLRYGGLNLRQKQSGNFDGQTRLSKKGRPLIRKLLNQAIIARVTKKALFGQYYHEKKDAGMIGPKAMVAVARKFLKMLFGLHHSQSSFEQKRVFQCASAYQAKAA